MTRRRRPKSVGVRTPPVIGTANRVAPSCRDQMLRARDAAGDFPDVSADLWEEFLRARPQVWK